MLIGLLAKNCPFIADNAASDASKLSKEMKPNPRDSAESGSRITLAKRMTPKLEKVSYNIFSSTISSKLPIKD